MLHEEAFFTLFEMTPDLVCIVNKDGFFKKINPAVSATLGYTTEELMAVPVSTFIHPADKARTAANRACLLTGKPLLNFQNRYLAKSGNEVWLEWTSIYAAENELVFAIAKNITIGKMAEIDLINKLESLHRLNTDVKQHTENHRQQIAGTLHEDLSQLAAAIKTKMEWLAGQQHALSPQHTELLCETLSATTQLLSKLQNLSYSISPGSLAIQGLGESLQGLCNSLNQHGGISCRFKSRYLESRLSDEEKLDLYRICQEALQNVVQHAAATEVTVFLRQTKNGLLLTISDNGVGFDLVSKKLSGISVMKARAMSVHAILTVNSDARGTTVSLLLKKRLTIQPSAVHQ